MALTLCVLIERWLDNKPKLKDYRIVPVVRAQGEAYMGDIMLWLPDMQRFPVGYIDSDRVDIFVPGRGDPPGLPVRHGGDPVEPGWRMLYAYDTDFFKDLEEHLLLIASRWK